MRLRYIPLLLFMTLLGFGSAAFAQIQIGDDLSEIDYSSPREYEIGGIVVDGAKYVDGSMLSMIADLRVGNTIKIPGDDISRAIRKIWEQGLFEDVSINATNFVGNKVFLQICIKERPRVSKFSFKGIKKSEADDIRNKINLSRGDIATDHLLTKTTRIIEGYYFEKGYNNVDIDIQQVADTARENYIDMQIYINKGPKVKIGKINVIGNEHLADGQILAAMKDTKQRGHFDPLSPLGPLVVNTVADVITLKPLRAITGVEEYFYDNYRPRIFKASKFLESNYVDDKKHIIEKYNAKGYRDARIVRDSVYRIDDKNLGIDLVIDEGNRYHYRNINWTGNTKYSDETLNSILGIKPGDVYNKELLDKNLNYSETNLDISSLYMDDGYLFFRVDPVEVAVDNDSIDLEIRLTEGKQARINNVTLTGNTKTYDHVVLRELYTRPGQLYSRSDVVRSIRELATLGFFNQESINPDVQPNFSDNTVDINYSVEEAAADQIRFSAGYGAGFLMLEAGLQFSNFSMRNIFNKKAWRPLPMGDGQKLSLNVTTYGTHYISYGLSFTEPWLGGRKPNALSVSLYQSYFSKYVDRNSPDWGWFKMTGGTIGLGRRLTWPDDYFSLYQGINLKRYNLNNYQTGYLNVGDGNGQFNLISYNFVLSRNSVSQPIYPRNGSEFQLGLEITPPYSLLSSKDYSSLEENEKYKWIEMHRWSFKAAWYTELYDKLVMMTRVRFGYLGHFNSQIGPTPFHRYYLGGDGLNNISMDSRELVGMRGYGNNALTPGYYNNSSSGGTGGNLMTKYTLEMRYPLSLNPQATIYALTFLEAGNCWLGFENFNPFEVKRSAGLGVRIFLPMFGLLGLDWGYGFDDVYGTTGENHSQFHFSIGGSID
ncbi:MAG: outer membrane protein/protective antigen OMA87 [bacterium F082]|nr:MAG: outer membrane protein/protective antigen OMA87 [bacterium F082]KWW30103.1 MAG: outer membrane protein/protective antigen OMA87 [bacterium P201]